MGDTEKNQPALDDLVSLAKASQVSELSPSYLRLLVNRGDIWGLKVGRNWVTTIASVEEFMSLERKRGPKPKKK